MGVQDPVHHTQRELGDVLGDVAGDGHRHNTHLEFKFPALSFKILCLVARIQNEKSLGGWGTVESA